MSTTRDITPLLAFSDGAPIEPTLAPFPAAKFAMPAGSANHLLRTSLLDQIASSTPRLLLVCAPAGFGKTTLLLQYGDRCAADGRLVAWCNLDGSDNDLNRFIQAVENSLQVLFGPLRTGHSAPQLLDVVAHCDQPFTLLLDEFENIHNPAVLDLVQQLVEALPPQATLALASRTVPELDLGRLRARGQLIEVSPEALRFSLDEARTYIVDQCQLELSESDIATLSERTEGWVTALYLATLSLRWQEDRSAFVSGFSGSNLDLTEFLAEDLLARQGDEVQQFLLQTSLLDQLCAPLCEALTGRQDSQEMLARLEQANLFLVPLDGEHRWFRYHNLFSDFLRSVLERQSPGLAHELRRKAAHWYLGEGRPDAAVEHLLAAGDLDAATEQLALHAKGWMLSGNARLLLHWLEQLPALKLEEIPALGLAYAWALMHARRYDDVQRLISRPALISHAATLRVQLLALTDRMEEAYQAGLQQLEQLSRTDNEAEYVLVSYYLSFCMVCTGRNDEARHLLARVPRQSGYLRNGADCVESVLDLTQGQLDSALARLNAAEQDNWNGGNNRTPAGSPSLLTCLGLALYEADELAAAEERLSHVLPHTKEMSSPDALITGHILLARMALLRGERDSWMRHLASLERLGHLAGSMRTLCSTWLERARVATLEGRLDTADYALRSAEQMNDWDTPDVLFYSNDVDTQFITRHRLRLAQGHFDGIDELRAALTDAQDRRRLRRALKLRLLLAMALDGVGEHAKALDELTVALRFASHVGLLRTFLDEGAPLATLLERWLVTLHGREAALGVETTFLATLKTRLFQEPLADTEHDTASSATVTTRELQVLRLLALGYRNREIAEKMFLSELTVKSHLRKINTKLGAQGRTEALAIARSKGLLD